VPPAVHFEVPAGRPVQDRRLFGDVLPELLAFVIGGADAPERPCWRSRAAMAQWDARPRGDGVRVPGVFGDELLVAVPQALLHSG
jgi:hypothetical protein